MGAGSEDAKTTNFFEQTKEASWVQCTNRGGVSFRRRNSGGVAIVGLDDVAQLLFASDASAELRPEGLVQNFVVRTDSPMRTDGIVMPDPCPNGVVELFLTEAHEAIEAFVLERADE